MSIDLHIDELVLQGFPALDYGRVGVALQRELERLFSQPKDGNTQATRVTEVVRLSMRLPCTVTPEWIGGRIAQDIYRSYCNGTEIGPQRL